MRIFAKTEHISADPRISGEIRASEEFALVNDGIMPALSGFFAGGALYNINHLQHLPQSPVGGYIAGGVAAALVAWPLLGNLSQGHFKVIRNKCAVLGASTLITLGNFTSNAEASTTANIDGIKDTDVRNVFFVNADTSEKNTTETLLVKAISPAAPPAPAR